MIKTIIFILIILITLLLITGAIYTAYSVRRIEQSYPPIGQFIETDGIKLHYVERGSGPVIVLIHGASTTLQDFTTSILPPLAEHFRVIAFDRPGYGYSERPAGPWPDPARQAKLIADGLQAIGVERAVWAGHSRSGSVVLAAMLNNAGQVAGGVLIGGGSHPWEGGTAWFYELAGVPVIGKLFAYTLVYPIGRLLLAPFTTAVFEPAAVSNGYAENTAIELALRPQTFLANAEDSRRLSDFLADQSRRYDTIEQPLLLLHGDADTIVPAWNHADRLIKQVPQAQLQMLPGQGHVPHHVEPLEISRLIAGFVAEIPGYNR
jgi:pimeloyl-ACP methyl ester carboxylesterase